MNEHGTEELVDKVGRLFLGIVARLRTLQGLLHPSADFVDAIKDGDSVDIHYDKADIFIEGYLGLSGACRETAEVRTGLRPMPSGGGGIRSAY